MARKEFSDRQKAELFVLDRATCAFSGRNLWLLDSGADSRYISDWVDHVTPASRGGDASIENGVCASAVYNFAKLDATSPPLMLFYRGLPTPQFFHVHDVVSDEIAANLARFGKLHYSDWFLNRAIWRACLGVWWLHDKTNQAGATLSRDAHYYAKASLKFLTKWRTIVAKENIKSLEERGLAPAVPSADQILLLAMRDATTEDVLLGLMQELLPFHSANAAALLAQVKLTAWEEVTLQQAEVLLVSIREDKRVSPVVLGIVEANFSRLKQAVWGSVSRFTFPNE